MLLGALVGSGPVITEPGALEFVGDLEKSRFRGHSKLFVRPIGCVHSSRPRDQEDNQWLLKVLLPAALYGKFCMPILQMTTLRRREIK